LIWLKFIFSITDSYVLGINVAHNVIVPTKSADSYPASSAVAPKLNYAAQMLIIG